MNFLKWLFGGSNERPKEKVKVVESATTKVEEKMNEVKAEKKAAGGFVDPETGKTYKSERALKAAVTRRKNAGKKKTVAKKAKQKRK